MLVRNYVSDRVFDGVRPTSVARLTTLRLAYDRAIKPARLAAAIHEDDGPVTEEADGSDF